MVECVEKFFLRTLFTDDKLYIINEQNIVVAVFVTELRHGRLIISRLTVLQRFDQFIGKCLACDI